MKGKLILLLWTAGMVFPINWLRKESPLLRRHLDPVSTPEWVHVLAHMTIFAIFAVMVVRTFKLPLNIPTVVMISGIILLTGGLQEVLQLTVKERPFGWPEVFDLGVDVIGGMAGGVFLVFQKMGKLITRKLA